MDDNELTNQSNLDSKTIPLIFAAHAFVRDAKIILGENQINKTELDLDKLNFLIDKAKACLDYTLPDLRQFLPREEN
jgi:hypothetical protein